MPPRSRAATDSYGSSHSTARASHPIPLRHGFQWTTPGAEVEARAARSESTSPVRHYGDLPCALASCIRQASTLSATIRSFFRSCTVARWPRAIASATIDLDCPVMAITLSTVSSGGCFPTLLYVAKALAKVKVRVLLRHICRRRGSRLAMRLFCHITVLPIALETLALSPECACALVLAVPS
jgi:hypothetical protein